MGQQSVLTEIPETCRSAKVFTHLRLRSGRSYCGLRWPDENVRKKIEVLIKATSAAVNHVSSNIQWIIWSTEPSMARLLTKI